MFPSSSFTIRLKRFLLLPLWGPTQMRSRSRLTGRTPTRGFPIATQRDEQDAGRGFPHGVWDPPRVPLPTDWRAGASPCFLRRILCIGLSLVTLYLSGEWLHYKTQDRGPELGLMAFTESEKFGSSQKATTSSQEGSVSGSAPQV